MKSLIFTTYCYIIKDLHIIWFIILGFLKTIIIPLIASYLDNFLSSNKGDKNNLILSVIISYIFPIIIEFLWDVLTKNIGSRVQNNYELVEWKRYSLLSSDDKKRIPADIFYKKVNNASLSVWNMVRSGISQVLGLINCLIYCQYILYSKNLTSKIMFVTLPIIIVGYHFIIKDMQYKLNEKRKIYLENKQRYEEKIKLKLSQFQHDQISVKYMLDLKRKIQKYNEDGIYQWLKIKSVSGLINSTSIIFIILSIKPSEYILVSNTIKKFILSVKHFTNFIDRYNMNKERYNSYEKLYKKTTKRNITIKKKINKNKIIGVSIKRGKKKDDYNIKFSKKVKSINFSKNSKILIQGETGSGKTTFVEALLGLINGIKLLVGIPSNYYWQISYMFQKIREKMTSNKVTIRDWFNDEVNNKIIYRCLQMCFKKKELKDILNNIKRKALKLGQKKQKSFFDYFLNEILSGGQKSRLCLATRIYELIKYDKDILVVDEPEQGTDGDTFIWMFQNVINFMNKKNKCVIVVTHACDCKLNKLNVKWDEKIYLRKHNNGAIICKK